MRISTSNIFDIGTAAIVRGQAEMMKTQQQLSSGRRLNSPADDPVAASEALRLRQADSLNSQYQKNQQTALGSLTQVESTLSDVTSLLQDVRAATIAAGNTSLSDLDRQSIAQDIAGRLEQLIGYANATDGKGSYLFGGYSDTAPPFSKTISAGGLTVQYTGDQGGRALQVSDTRAIDLSVNGSSVFERVTAGNGTFTTAAGAGNTGTGLISTGQVTDTNALVQGHSYQIVFTGTGTTYDVVDTTTATTIASGQAYVDGSAITGVPGMQFDISGTPDVGDVFDIEPATSQSIFDTLQNLVNVLNTPVADAAERTTLTSNVGISLLNLDNALNNILATRATMGARMNEIQSLQASMSDQNTSLKTALSQIEDVDYASAISQLSKQQLILEAAQKSFVSVSSLSIFNYM